MLEFGKFLGRMRASLTDGQRDVDPGTSESGSMPLGACSCPRTSDVGPPGGGPTSGLGDRELHRPGEHRIDDPGRAAESRVWARGRGRSRSQWRVMGSGAV